jgi:hypothetical protein
MHRLREIAFLLVPIMVLALSGCDIINPKEELPAYISFQDPQVVIDETTGFSTNAGIRNIWLYHGGFLQGVYQIDPEIDTNGRVIPFLQLDKSDFFIDGGMYETGQSSFQIPHPFWDRITFNWEAPVGDTLVLTPRFHYVDPSNYITPVVEHFEGGSIDFLPFGSGLIQDSTFLKVRQDDVFHGTGVGYVQFGPGDRWFEVINGTGFYSTQASNIFAEITYKNTIPFTVGLIYQSSQGTLSTEIVTVNPSSTWNTIYVHMITEVRNIINSTGPSTIFWLWLKADGEGNEGYIRFDDIRVIRENKN